MRKPLIIPYCTGMERSASRMTWQIVKKFAPAEPPEDWYPEWHEHIYNFHVVDSESGKDREFINWPMRGHEYYPDVPIVYTYRNPVEAFLSLYSRMAQDVGKQIPGPTGKILEPAPGVRVQEHSWTHPVIQTKDDAMRKSLIGIGKHWMYWKKYQDESRDGRKVLMLKYEDFYHDHRRRVEAVAKFMNADVGESDIIRVAEDTSLSKNLQRVQAISAENPKAVFSGGGFLGETGLQVGHVNSSIKGSPGLHIKTQPRIVEAIKSASGGALEALREMTFDMGYEL